MSFEIIRPLGRGGMGEVYLARDTRLDRQVALKTLRSDLQTGDFVSRLRREARLLAQLNHPHIVQLYDITEWEGEPALVMEYVEGQNLHICLRENRGDYGDRLRWLAEIAAALEAAHCAGIVHRDLKAENVLISRLDSAKVTDFGIAEEDTLNSRRDQDIAALGELARRLLEGFDNSSPGLQHLMDRLSASTAGQLPTAAEAAEGFRLAWHEATQADTLIPAAPDELVATPSGIRGRVIGATALVLTVAAAVWFFNRVPDSLYVAVLDTHVADAGDLGQELRLGLQTTVEQALRQSVIASPTLRLVSARETSGLRGSATDIAGAVGADEAVTTSLSCLEWSCDLTLQRVDQTGAVLASRSTSLLPDAMADAWNIVVHQWPFLYPDSGQAGELGEFIDEADFSEYLELTLAADAGSGQASELATFKRAEALLARADRFLPLYRLYIDSALDLHDETSDPAYLRRAERVLDGARTWAGDSPLLHQALFDLSMERGDHAAAEETLSELRRLSPDRAMIHRLAARLHSEQARYAQADRHYQQALALRPGRNLRYDAAWNFYEWGRPEEAGALLKASLAAYPQDPRPHDMLGMIKLHAGDLEDAAGHFHESLLIEQTVTTRSNLGLTLLLQGDYARAREEFIRLYEDGNRTAIMLINLADTEALMGNQEAADRLYGEVIAGQTRMAKPNDPRALSQAYAQLGQYERAIAALKQGENSRRRNSEDSFNAALVYTLAGQHIAAIVEVEEALASGFSGIWFTLPFFDPLCADPAFETLLGEADIDPHCEQQAARTAL